jgi:hypothetical protein
MDNKIERNQDTDASPESAVATIVMSPEERKVQLERLICAVRVTGTFLHAIAASKKLLHKLSAPFLEKAGDQDSQKKISARKSRQRNAVFLAAKDVLDPNHPIKKSVAESLEMFDKLDDAIISNARVVKEKILEKLDGLINQALKDTEKEQSAESIEKFSQTVQDLKREMDLRQGETLQLHKKLKAELRQAWIKRLATIRNLMIVAAILAVDGIASVGYMLATQEKASAPEIVEPFAEQASATQPDVVASPTLKKEKENQPKKVIPAQSITASAPSKTVSAPATTDTLPNKNLDKNLDSPPVTVSTQKQATDIKADNGGISLSSGQDTASMKKNVHALRDAIRAWNAENTAQGDREKTNGKK